MTPATMHAWMVHAHGGEEAMRRESVPVPQPREGELLVRVEAASMNPIDWKMRAGLLGAHFQPVFPRSFGRDCCGTVAALGAGVAEFSVGERVLAAADPLRGGTHAPYAVVPAAMAARLPAGVAPEEAACLGIAGVSAYIPLVEVAALQSGQRVLIHAGAGGVGHIALQIARNAGADAVATAGSANIEFCRSLGANRVVDYSREHFEDTVRDCDVAFDVLGGAVHRGSHAVLKPGGLLVYLNSAPIDPTPPRADVRVVRAEVRASGDRLAKLLEWLAAGRIRPHISERLSLRDTPRAYALSATGHVRGKIVLLAD